jgi:hypothetical protein
VPLALLYSFFVYYYVTGLTGSVKGYAVGGGLDGPLRNLPQNGLRGRSPRSERTSNPQRVGCARRSVSRVRRAERNTETASCASIWGERPEARARGEGRRGWEPGAVP